VAKHRQSALNLRVEAAHGDLDVDDVVGRQTGTAVEPMWSMRYAASQRPSAVGCIRLVGFLSPDNGKIGGLAFLFDFNTYKGREKPDIAESHLSEQFLVLRIRVSFIGQRVKGHFVGFGVNDEESFRCR